MRKISNQYLNTLKYGFLTGLLEAVHEDKDLDFQIREN